MKSRISLRVVLVLLNACLVTLVLAGAAGLLYTGLRRTMLKLVDRSLEEALLAAVEEISYQNGLPRFDEDSSQDPDEPVNYRIAPFEDRNLAAWITSVDGTVLDTRDDWPGPFRSNTGDGARVVETAEGIPWRTYSRPLLDDSDSTVGWIHTAQPLTFIRDTLRKMTGILVAGLSAILLLTVVTSWLLTHLALRPLTDIAATAAMIDGTNWRYRLGYQGSITEIAELSDSFDRMLERLKDVFERERRFTADAAHELRTPLTALKGHIDLALGRDRSAKEHTATLKVLRSYVDRLVGLTVDLLFMARLDQDARRNHFTPVQLDNLIRSVADQIMPALGSRRLTINGAGREVLVDGDMDHLIRLFTNLLDNAVKYSPEKGRIEVRISTDQGAAQVAVGNTGAGIPETELSRIFDRFYRVENDRSRTSGGSGLGLAIARTIAEKHGGGIRVQIEPEKSIVFTVRLPLLSGKP